MRTYEIEEMTAIQLAGCLIVDDERVVALSADKTFYVVWAFLDGEPDDGFEPPAFEDYGAAQACVERLTNDADDEDEE